MYEKHTTIDPRVNPDTYALSKGMKRGLFIAFVLGFTMLFSGCTKNTVHGECIGITDKQDPKLEYAVEKGNVVIGAIFIETGWVPVNVLFWNFYCPIGAR